MSKFKFWKQPIQLTSHNGKYTYRATANQLKGPLYGLKSTEKWPAEGLPQQWFKGILFWVNPLGKKLTIDHGYYIQHTRKGMHSRLMCECPKCSKIVSYGRLHQHLRIHYKK